MDRTPNNTSHSLLVGSIDTPQEIKTILAILKQEQEKEPKYRLQRQVTDMEIIRLSDQLKHELKKEWSKNHIEGSVDTPREIQLFFGILKRERIISGPIDTPEEAKLFMEKLQQLGVFLRSFADLKPKPAPAHEEELPRRKRKRPTDDDDEDYRRHP